MKYLIAILLLASYAYGASLPVVENPCVDSELYYLRYYQPYPLDDTKYIQCYPWGTYDIRDCRVGFKWNSWLGRCSNSLIEKTINATMDKMQHLSAPVLNTTSVLVDRVNVTSDGVVGVDMPFLNTSLVCSYYGNQTCLNGGLCNVYPLVSRCLCLSGYSGDLCELNDTKSFGVFGSLINDTFSLDVYRKQRPLLQDIYVVNQTIDLSLVTDKEDKDRIVEYLALYGNGSMRFDILLSYLIQDYLYRIYPSQFFLQEFSFPSEIASGYENAIPGLLMSAKYAYDRFDDLWSLYDDVLRRLVSYLPQYLPQIRKESQLFFQIYDAMFRDAQIKMQSSQPTERLVARDLNLTVNGVDMEITNETLITVDMIKAKLRRDFNATLVYSYELFDLADALYDDLSINAIDKNITYFQEAVSNFTQCDNVTTLIGLISETNAEIFDSLSFYGFWYVIAEFVDPVQFNVSRTSSVDLVVKNSSVARLLQPSMEFNKTRVPVFQALVSDSDFDVESDPTRFNVSSLDDERPFVARLVSSVNVTNTTILPVVQKLVTDVKLNASNVAVKPTVARLVSGEVMNKTKIIPERLVSVELNKTSEVVKPTAGHLVSSNVTANSTTVPVVQKLVGDEDSDGQPEVPEVPESEVTTPSEEEETPSADRLLADVVTTTVVVPTTTIRPVVPSKSKKIGL